MRGLPFFILDLYWRGGALWPCWAATWLSKRVKMEVVAIEMDGLSAVMKADGKSKIYSAMMMRSYISPSLHFSERMSVNIGIGGNWIRTINLSDRSLKGFFDSFSTDDDEPHSFRPSLRFTAGFIIVSE